MSLQVERITSSVSAVHLPSIWRPRTGFSGQTWCFSSRASHYVSSWCSDVDFSSVLLVAHKFLRLCQSIPSVVEFSFARHPSSFTWNLLFDCRCLRKLLQETGMEPCCGESCLFGTFCPFCHLPWACCHSNWGCSVQRCGNDQRQQCCCHCILALHTLSSSFGVLPVSSSGYRPVNLCWSVPGTLRPQVLSHWITCPTVASSSFLHSFDL